MAGIVSFVFIRAHAGNGSALLWRQQHAQALNAGAVERAVKAAPDPVAEPVHTRGTAASCVPRGRGGLLNPWRCSIRYPSGREIRYLVTIHAGGSFTGDHEIIEFRGRSRADTGVITGCCVLIP